MHFLTREFLKPVVVIFLFTTVYAVVRYNVFKGVDWDHLPLYVLNKSVSLTALALIAASYVAGKLFWRGRLTANALASKKKGFAFFGYLLAGLHILMSMTIMSQKHYPKLYDATVLNLKGEGSMLAGLLAFAFFSIPALASLPGIDKSLGEDRWRQMQRIGYLGVLCSTLHVLIMGWSGWWDVAAWPGHLPPITLLSCILALVPLVTFLLAVPPSLQKKP